MNKIRVLIGCEFSGVVREAFNAIHGVHAISCDIIPAQDGRTDYHYQGDVRDIIKDAWDLIILHPPCTFTAICGNRWYSKSPLRLEGAMFTKELWELARQHCNHVALEQPKTIMQRYIGKRSQSIQPYQFGHGETKETWLWLKNLPLLKPTNNVEGREHRIHEMPPSPTRGMERSITYAGIARAMAEQWTNHLLKNLENGH